MRLLVTAIARPSGPDRPGLGDVAVWWGEAVPTARVTTRLLSDGRVGFLDALAQAAPDDVTVAVPGGGQFAVRSDGRGTVYVAAEPLGSSRVVGRVLAAVAPTADRIVLATGGAHGHDGGAGLIAELARVGGHGLPATSRGADHGPVLAADHGEPAVAQLSALTAEEATRTLEAARSALRGVDLVAAIDDDAPLLGLHGATARLGERSGAPGAWVEAALTPGEAQHLERELGAFAHRMGAAATALDANRRLPLASSGRERPTRYAALPGAGSGGGLGHGVALLGGRQVAAVRVVADAVGLAADLADADLAVVLADDLDAREMVGGALPEVTALAAPLAVPVVVLTGSSAAGRREWSAAGVSGVYELGDDPAGRVRRVAATWSGA